MADVKKIRKTPLAQDYTKIHKKLASLVICNQPIKSETVTLCTGRGYDKYQGSAETKNNLVNKRHVLKNWPG